MECTICFNEPENYTVDGKIVGCGHTFCWSCIVQWKNTEKKNGNNPTCPKCRSEFLIIEKIIPPFYNKIKKKRRKKRKKHNILLEEEEEEENNEFIVDNIHVERKCHEENEELILIKQINTIFICFGIVFIVAGIILNR